MVLGWINFQKEHQSQTPDDGVWWLERNSHLVADRLDPNGPAARAGIRAGDVVVSINGREVTTSAARMRQLYYSGVWSKATYSLIRNSVPLDVQVVLAPADLSPHDWLRLIALIYLGIGLYVLMRRWTAVGSTHFYIFCLVSFVSYAFHYTGKLNGFDSTIYWCNVVAWLLQPALFLHFVLTFPEKRGIVRKHAWFPVVVYIPAALLLSVAHPDSPLLQSQRAPELEYRPRADAVRWPRTSRSRPACSSTATAVPAPRFSASSSNGSPAARCSRSPRSRSFYVLPYLVGMPRPG